MTTTNLNSNDGKGRLALVTGGSGGIGSEFVDRLCRAGYKVAFVYYKGRASALELEERLKSEGLPVRAIEQNLEMLDSASRIREALGSFSKEGVSVLVSNAGCVYRPSDWQDEAPTDVEKSINLNLRAHILLTQEFAPDMRGLGWGRLVYVSSTYGEIGLSPILSYSASKLALISVCRAMAKELGSFGVTANCISPGNIATEMTNGAGKDVIRWIEESTPVGRLGRVEEIGNALDFILHNPFVNGTNIVVDGGHKL
ncbi:MULTISPECIES: SDR family NAD(P)-dependent oxidoreductase [unclassified Mameliella]|uniref:SDR family NAD(P)-dependent oxidoreductase n=1 Tax=unclassified Mameliella TaxID=2630630 RepID=UPI00273E2794|nr:MULTISPECIES: SDR family NAD(P)-dependent oxidoreductase [unclassified Mameliella]